MDKSFGASDKKILVFDIGNTNIKVAIVALSAKSAAFSEKEFFLRLRIEHEWRISSSQNRTGDEYFAILRPLFREADFDTTLIEGAALSSVVPSLTGPFVKVTEHITKKKPLIIAPGIYKSLPIKLPAGAASEIGSDLLCNALAAFCLYGAQPSIICDFGTAMSFVSLGGAGAVKGVAIAPGLQTAVNSLFSQTAQLPQVPLIEPQSVLGDNTVSAIQAGVVLGYHHLVTGLIGEIKSELEKIEGDKVIHTIATGGLNSTLSNITGVFETIDKDLTVKGIAMAYYYAEKGGE